MNRLASLETLSPCGRGLGEGAFVCLLFLVVAAASPTHAAERIYTLIPDTPFDGSPFGFSGTITTDGRTGYFSEVSFIKDWAITVHTPSEVDGISTEVFTRDSGPPIRAFASTGSQLCECIHVTESTISIDAPSPPLTNRVLAIGVAGSSPTSIYWIGPYFTLTGRPREVQIVDVGESPQLESRMFGDLSSLPVAAGGVAIPEPTSAASVFLAIAVMVVAHRTRSCACRRTLHRSWTARLLVALSPLLLISAAPAQAADRVYTLVPDTPFDDSPFGFSGTITTDGSTGHFSDVSFIKDWSITVETPSDFDGVSAEVLTSDSYPPIRAGQLLGYRRCACFHVTESSISIVAPSSPLESLTLLIGRTDVFIYPTILSWTGPYFASAAFPGSVTIGDRGESPSSESRTFGDLSSLPVATGGVAIPEPSTTLLLPFALAAILGMRRAKSPAGSRVLLVAASLLPLVGLAAPAHADIYQWEYINPADPSQGKRQSATLAPDGAGVDAVPGADISGRNLIMAYLIGADLTGASGYSSNLTDADLSQANLTDGIFGYGATLMGADLSRAEVRGADFSNYVGTGITFAQLYSTASYQQGDLSRIGLGGNNLSGWNFASQNLTNAYFGSANLTGANFREANLANVNFHSDSIYCRWSPNGCVATLNGADLTAADARGAIGLVADEFITANFIWPDGHIAGLGLEVGNGLVVRDYDGDPTRINPFDGAPAPLPPIPITVDQHLSMGLGGTLRMVFEADAWDSTISFAPGIPVTLGGTLELTFADDVNLASQRGHTFDLFDWTGVDPTGTFAVSSPYHWDLSALYTTGEVTLTAIPEPTALALVAFVLPWVVGFRRRVRRPRYLLASSLGMVLMLFNGANGPSRAAAAPVTVMSQNLYQGFDAEQFVADVSANPGNVVALTTAAYAQVLANDFQARADAIAASVDQHRPALIGLQEVTLYRSATFDGPGPPHATNVEIDYLDTLLGALSARGLSYAAVATVQNTDAEFPRLVGFDGGGNPILQDIRLTDRDVVLARSDLPLDQLEVSNPQSGNYAAIVSALGVNFLSGWTAVEVEADGRAFRFVNTHLARGAAAIQVLQAAELVAGPAGTSLPTILVGDFNSRADGSGTASYANLITAGFAGAWSSLHPGDPGYTCCQAANLLNDPSQLTERIDLVLTRNGPVALDAFLVGAAAMDRTPAGLWPSDHAGLVTTLNIVPEPSGLALAAFGLLGLVVRVRRPLPRIAARSTRNDEPHAQAQRRGGVCSGWSSLRPQRLCVSLLSIVVFASAARADIYQWEYVNPLDPSQGKQQSTTLAPDGAGVDAVPGTDLYLRDLTKAYLVGADLKNAFAEFANLTTADLTEANLTDARFSGATLTNADFTNAEVLDASFSLSFGTGAGITLDQLYSTASYKAHDLSGIGLSVLNLTGGNFASQNLTGAFFGGATLTDANFTGAEVRRAHLGRTVRCGRFASCTGSGITLAQLYSTASYQAHDLSGINLEGNDLAGGHFAGYNLTNSYIYANLTAADLTAADARGAILNQSNAITANLILPHGEIEGLDLDTDRLLVVRDYDGGTLNFPDTSPIPITVDQHLTMGPGGTLRMAFEADAWDSTISFAPGIPVTLGGTLELTFAADVNIASQRGRTFDLFDWTGVDPTGMFAISSPYAWDTSNLYTTGQITLTAIPEPTSAALVLLAAAAMFVSRRTRLCVGLRSAAFDKLRPRACRGEPGRSLTPHRWSTAGLLVSLSPLLLVSPSPAHADIYQWEYIDPNDPSQGKQQSTTLAPDGAGVDFVRGAELSGRNLTMAYLSGADLFAGDTSLFGSNLTGTNLSRADLTNAILAGANLTGTEFSDADVLGASFDKLSHVCGGVCISPFPPGHRFYFGTGIALPQLYSTASYQARNLSGIDFTKNELAGGNFAGQNLTNASFYSATLTDADFREANLTNTGFFLANLTGANFAGQNLTNKTFKGAALTDADFTGAEVRGASFARDYLGQGTGISPAQLYSTASYQAHDLSGINLLGNYLVGANFVGQNLASATLGTNSVPSYVFTDLTGADFSHANLANANFAQATLTDADFTGADTRGAYFGGLSGSGTIRTNLILPHGHIDGLVLDGGRLLSLRDYRDYVGNPSPFPITVDQHLTMAPGGTLRMVFEADAWDSTISFAPGIPVALGGALELTFADDVNLASQRGRTFDLFDWAGVSPTGAFDVDSPYHWDLSNLYTTGELTLIAVPEPATCVLALGLFTLFVTSRQRLQRPAQFAGTARTCSGLQLCELCVKIPTG